MMDRTDRHCRYFLRLMAPNAWLYTEMVTAAAVVHGDADRLLAFNDDEHPVAVQLGGSDPALLASATRLAARAGYDEVNLNVGCPSDRVQAGRFGAALMAEPELVGACVRAMHDAADVPVTVKTRLGIDDLDSYAFLTEFVAAVADAGCRTFIVHARKAWLKGLSPKENRSVPPLDYARVRQLKRDFPHLEIVVNGGLDSAAVVINELQHVDGVMLGRAAYSDPWALAGIDARLHGGQLPTIAAVLDAMLGYVRAQRRQGVPVRAATRHWLGLFAGRPGARRWRRFLSELPDGEQGVNALSAFVHGHCGSGRKSGSVDALESALA